MSRQSHLDNTCLVVDNLLKHQVFEVLVYKWDDVIQLRHLEVLLTYSFTETLVSSKERLLVSRLSEFTFAWCH